MPRVSPSTCTTGSDAVRLAELRLHGRIHDGPLQLLAAALQELEPASVAADHVRRASAELRDLLRDPPEVLSGRLVAQRLTWWSGTVMREGSESEVSVDVRSDQLTYLPYEAARELLSNAIRHAGASRVHVTICDLDERTTEVVVRDDGIGIGPTWRPGFGLASLHARVTLTGGAVDYRPGADGGTQVRVVIPRDDSPTTEA